MEDNCLSITGVGNSPARVGSSSVVVGSSSAGEGSSFAKGVITSTKEGSSFIKGVNTFVKVVNSFIFNLIHPDYKEQTFIIDFEEDYRPINSLEAINIAIRGNKDSRNFNHRSFGWDHSYFLMVSSHI